MPTEIIMGVVFAFFFVYWVVKKIINLNVFVDQGQALIIIGGSAEPRVTFTRARVIPVIMKSELMDISLRTIDIDRRGKEGLICQDNLRADIKVTFFVRVNRTPDDVIRVAQAIGTARASDPATLDQLFNAKFSEALKTVGKQMDFIELYTHREKFRDRIIESIGRDLNGFMLEDAAIDYLEQTPKSALDKDNILDAQGIKKITELTAVEQIKTNEFERDRDKQMLQKNVDTREKMADLERQQADAEVKKQREIETMTARERAETEKVKAEEQLRAEKARIAADEELAIDNEKKNQEIALARINAERLQAIEKEKMEKDRMLEAVSREREVELHRIAKERDLEEQRKLIQDVIRERIAVEKTVAEEEERIKTLRLTEEAKRQKEATVITAQAEAEQSAAKLIRNAEASETVSRLKAKEKLTLAEAELASADKVAQAKVRLAEGIQAEEAAMGLAEIRVKEADAVAFEKKGLAEVRIKEASTEAFEKQGLAEARVKEAKAPAEEKLGLAAVSVDLARANTDAEGIKSKLLAEAAGIAEKAKSMAALNEASRAHEEYRLQLENQRIISLEAMKTQVHMAEHQAKVMGEAFRSAKINIMGGDGVFLERLLNAASLGHSLDGFINNSETAKGLLAQVGSGAKTAAGTVAEKLKPLADPKA